MTEGEVGSCRSARVRQLMDKVLGAMIRDGHATIQVPVSMTLASKSCQHWDI